MGFSPAKPKKSKSTTSSKRVFHDQDWVNAGLSVLSSENQVWVSPLSKRTVQISHTSPLQTRQTNISLGKGAILNSLAKDNRRSQFQRSSSVLSGEIKIKWQLQETQSQLAKVAQENQKLKIALKKAEKRVENEAQAKGRRIQMLKAKLTEVRRQKELEADIILDHFRDSIMTKRRKIHELQRRNNSMSNQFSDLAKDLHEANMRNQRMGKALSEARRTTQKHIQNTKALQHLLESSEEDLRQAERDQQELVNKLLELQQAMQSNKARLSQNPRQEHRFKQLMQCFNEQVKHIRELEDNLKQERQRRLDAEQLVVRKQRVIEALKQRLLSVEQENERLKEEMNEGKKLIQQANQTMEKEQQWIKSVSDCIQESEEKKTQQQSQQPARRRKKSFDEVDRALDDVWNQIQRLQLDC